MAQSFFSRWGFAQQFIGVAGATLKYGERIHLLAKLRLPRNFGNPGAFDYEGYLHGRGIVALASVKADKIEVVPGTSGSRFGFWRSRIRNSILLHLREKGLWEKDEAALFAAMIVGDDSMLMRNVREEFQQTGVYHLLVVSGMNVALLAFAIFWLARRLRLPKWPASLLTIALSMFYAYIAGMGVPIMRAVLMLSLFLVARLLYRDRSGLNATGFAALVVLVLSPAALFDAGLPIDLPRATGHHRHQRAPSGKDIQSLSPGVWRILIPLTTTLASILKLLNFAWICGSSRTGWRTSSVCGWRGSWSSAPPRHLDAV